MANRKIRGITVEIGGDFSKLGDALKDSEEQSKSLQSELKEVERALKFNPDNVELLAQKQEILTKQVAATEDALDKLKAAEKQVAAQFESGEIGEEQYRAFQREVITTESKLNNYKSKLNDAEESNDDFGKSIDDAGDKSEKFNEKLDKAAIGVAALGAALIALGKEAIDAFNEVDEGADNVIKATGATGELAESLDQSFKNVSSTIVGDFSTIGSVLGEVNTRFGYTEAEAEKATTQFMKFAEVTGMDAVTAVQDVSRAIESAGLETSDYERILDSLTTAGQVTGVSVDTLAKSLTDNGAVMREMGYDTDATIAMLAQFEKAGVDSNAVVKGMRTAIAKWSKDGKDAKTEFSKLVKGIQDGSADAGEAYEVFGSKAGVELVDAIKSGRFAYDDMVKVIEKSKGSLDSTFDGTIDGGYELDLTLQKAKLKFAELGETAAEKVVPVLADELLPIAEKFIDYVTENIDDIIPLVKTLGIAFATIFVVNKVATFANSIKSLKTAFTSLGATMSAHPLMLFATVLAGIGVALYAVQKETEKQIQKTWGLSEATKKLNEQIHEEANALKEATKARQEANKEIEAEMGHNQNLWKELQSIVDANGKIKKGYEDRAKVITTLLADSLGIEIEIVDGQIKKYGELKKSIEDVIATKKAEALLDVNKSAYNEALSKQDEAFAIYNQKIADFVESEKKLNEAQAILDEAIKKRDNASNSHGAVKRQSAVNKAQDAVDAATEAHKKNKKALDEANESYLQYCTTIQNYDGLMEAVANGDAKALNVAMTNLSKNFKTTENATESMLKKQLKDFKEQYANMKLAVEKGMPGVSQEQVEQMGDLVTRAETELNKLQDKSKKSGEKSGEKFAEGVKSKQSNAKKSGETVAKETDKGLNTTNTKKSGEKSGKNYADGVKSQESNAKNAGKKLAANVDKSLTSPNTSTTGAKKGKEYASGVESQKGSAKTAGKKVAESGKSGLESIKATSSGEDFASGFGKGIKNKEKSIWSKAWDLGKSALSAIKKALGIKSPSKETELVGGFFDEGMAIGVKKNKDAVLKNADELAKDALKSLSQVNEVEFGGLNIGSNSTSKKLRNQVSSAEYNSTSTADNALGAKLDAIYDRLGRIKMVTHTGALVGEMLDDIDAGLAERQSLNSRGV